MPGIVHINAKGLPLSALDPAFFQEAFIRTGNKVRLYL